MVPFCHAWLRASLHETNSIFLLVIHNVFFRPFCSDINAESNLTTDHITHALIQGRFSYYVWLFVSCLLLPLIFYFYYCSNCLVLCVHKSCLLLWNTALLNFSGDISIYGLMPQDDINPIGSKILLWRGGG